MFLNINHRGEYEVFLNSNLKGAYEGVLTY